jgi:hypothetical protein
MDYITSFIGYISGKQEISEKDKLIKPELEKDEICNIEPTLTPNSMISLPDNKYVLEKIE